MKEKEQAEKVLLSIDLDFFIREDLIWDFGHSESNKLFMTDFLWNAARYHFIDLYKETDIKTYADCIPHELAQKLKDIGFTFGKKTKVGAGWSHQFAFDFFKDCQAETIFNFDAHHDCYSTEGKELTCGNWLLKLQELKKIKDSFWIIPKWYTNGLTDAQLTLKDKRVKHLKKLSLNKIPKKLREVEAVYIAQSPSWVPPHHDQQFHILRWLFCIHCEKKDGQLDRDDGYAKREVLSKKEAQRIFKAWQKQKRQLQKSIITEQGNVLL